MLGIEHAILARCAMVLLTFIDSHIRGRTMAFHSTKSIVGVLVICTLQSVFFACVSASRTPHDQSPSISPESTRISEVGKLPVTDTWYSAQIVNENDVFLATPKGLWRSFNGGRTWEEVYESREYGGTITKTYFLNSSIGWMETHSGWFKSEDGGHTWESFGNPLSSSGRLRDIKFINRETGWIAGATLPRLHRGMPLPGRRAEHPALLVRRRYEESLCANCLPNR